jgi:hypothetical protein
VPDTGVVYLYRHAEGKGPVRTFVDSYRAYRAGADHDLHVIFKGFPGLRSLGAARRLFEPFSINIIECEDEGYDIGSYIAAAQSLSNRRLIFFNTFSEILADNWLAYFENALDQPGIGVVGATGSWQALSSGPEALIKGIWRHPVSYLKHSEDGKPMFLSDTQHPDARPPFLRLALDAARLSLYPLRLYQYGRYPNPHIRTNAFMIRRKLFLSLHATRFKRKSDVYRFESGRRSMTKQITALGLAPLLVDRFGRSYRLHDWKKSSTFWVDDQANLLIADNQTRDYAAGTAERRMVFENYAWNPPSSWAGEA